MAKTIWKGAISFSLIHIPVGLYTAAKANNLDLDLLDRHDFSPVGYQRYNKASGKPVEWNDIVKGYEYEDGQYVVLTDEDFRRANVEASRTIDIQTFVRPQDIPPHHFETPYYVAPEKGGEKVYTLLHQAMTKSGTAAIALVVIRTRQHLCALVPIASGLLLNTLRFADEIVPPPDALTKEPGTRKQDGIASKEFSMALKLIEEMRSSFGPEQFHDTYREDLMKRIEEKVRLGQTKMLTAPDKEPRRARASNVVDLTELLRNSLAQRGGARGGGKSGGRPAAVRRPARKRRA